MRPSVHPLRRRLLGAFVRSWMVRVCPLVAGSNFAGLAEKTASERSPSVLGD